MSTKSAPQSPKATSDERFLDSLTQLHWLSGLRLMRTVIVRTLMHPIQYFALIVFSLITVLLSFIPYLGVFFFFVALYFLVQYVINVNFANCFKPLHIQTPENTNVEYTFSVGIFIFFFLLFLGVSYGTSYLNEQAVTFFNSQQLAHGFALYFIAGFISTVNFFLFAVGISSLIFLKKQPTFVIYLKNILEFFLLNFVFIFTALFVLGTTSIIMGSILGIVFSVGVILIGYSISASILMVVIFLFTFPFILVFFAICGYKLNAQLYDKTIHNPFPQNLPKP